jgi:hypothetical protein
VAAANMQRPLPSAVTCLAFEPAPCAQPWLLWGGTAGGGVAVWDLRSTGGPLTYVDVGDADAAGGLGGGVAKVYIA